MQTTSRQAGTSAVPEPADSNIAVVFRGDGEPKTPQDMLRQLAEFHAETGLEQDSFSLGGTVEKLERRFAGMLGKEAAIFMPTGTLANHMAIRKLCGVKPRAVVQEQSHLYQDTGDCVTQLSGINLVPLGKGRPFFTLDELEQIGMESVSGRVVSPIGAVMIESPVRRQMGQVMPFDEMKAITAFCREQGIATHLDGARLYMMSAASGVKPLEYTSLYDTVYVSLYKYFGAPFGAILAGTAGFVEGMYHARRMFGGGLASACMAAALALQGSEGFEERFCAAIGQARELFERLNTLSGIRIKTFKNGSNIFPLEIDASVDEARFVDGLRQRRVLLYPDEGADRITRLTVNTTILRQSNDALFEAFREALAES